MDLKDSLEADPVQLASGPRPSFFGRLSHSQACDRRRPWRGPRRRRRSCRQRAHRSRAPSHSFRAHRNTPRFVARHDLPRLKMAVGNAAPPNSASPGAISQPPRLSNMDWLPNSPTIRSNAPTKSPPSSVVSVTKPFQAGLSTYGIQPLGASSATAFLRAHNIRRASVPSSTGNAGGLAAGAFLRVSASSTQDVVDILSKPLYAVSLLLYFGLIGG